jgi:hypothetical protein
MGTLDKVSSRKRIEGAETLDILKGDRDDI